ncbi:hypothetical protein Desor_1892 [Desulfosporosinus orientis DSM 765]|uniref:Uncharacterized protein n=1 Tax=Desulfosporosinus orientis (strain ATCC 19365 / DSM 765 / NCIMB 8382 / VKM B-1628 / Singapore I) TaxID=768706 RepID=G7WB22_DESOD|nr:hypothetical protein [Desulfosporosinus orientis]AET67523.1 hypothetical protein Desor_1892 [Desulfosporosinus orientis DSM 765]
MDISEVIVNGSIYDEEYHFNNYALTLVFKESTQTEKTVRANLRYYPGRNQWDLNPIYFEYTENEKEDMIQQIINNEYFKAAFEQDEKYLQQ